MLRVFSTNVLTVKEIQLAQSKSISIDIDNRVIKFTLCNKVIQLTQLPTDFYWYMSDEGLLLSRHSVAVKNFQKLFYHKITGTYRSLIKNAINGLLNGYVYKLYIVGSGYRSSYDEKTHCLSLYVGFANTVKYYLKSDVSIKLEANGTDITFTSYNKESVTSDRASIIRIKKHNVYSGTGILTRRDIVRKSVKKKS